MMKLLVNILIIFQFVFYGCSNDLLESDPNESQSEIPIITLNIKDNDLSDLIENRFTDYSAPAQIQYNNSMIPARVSSQGAGSRFYPKWSYKIECENGYTIENMNKFNLSAQVNDNTMIRTILASTIFKKAGFPVFSSRVIFLKINGENKGLYLLNERVDEEFFNRRTIKIYELIKTIIDATFSFSGGKNCEESFEKKIPDDNNYSNISTFINQLDKTDTSNIFSGLEKYLDIKGYISYHAVASVILHADGFENNFYFYKSIPSDPYRIIPWDFDRTFDPNYNIDTYGENEIIMKLLQNDSCKKMYKRELKVILNENFKEEILFPVIDSVFYKIKRFYSFDPYLKGSDGEINNRINILKTLIIERRNRLISIGNNW
jgi:spore coat protein CotH